MRMQSIKWVTMMVLSVIAVIIISPAEASQNEDTVRLAVDRLVSSYESRHVEKVLELFSLNFINQSGIERSLRDEYDRYHSIEVLTRIGVILFQKDIASARVKWYKKRIDLKNGSQEKVEGEVTLYFRYENEIYKLIRWEGKGFLPEPFKK